MEEILMKIFISVEYFIVFRITIGSQWDILNTMDHNQITMGYPNYYGSQSDRHRIS